MSSLEYRSLVDNYHAELQSCLRNFSPGHEFLEGWVPDEDITSSVSNLFESAECAGSDEVTLRLQDTEVGTLDLPLLRQYVARIGTVDLNEGELAFVPYRRLVSPIYLKKIKQRARDIRYEANEMSLSEAKVLSAGGDRGRIACALDDKRIVTKARHAGSRGVDRTILDELCRNLEGMPAGAITQALFRAEENLREDKNIAAVPGVVTWWNLPTEFNLAKELLTKLSDTYFLAKEKEFWSVPPSSSWLALAPYTQGKIVQETIPEILRELGLPEHSVSLVEIRGNTRVVVRSTVADSLIKFERKLKEKIEGSLEIILETREDKNKRIAQKEVST